MQTEPLLDWVRGDLLGLEFPAHADALRDDAQEFLTRAFRESDTGILITARTVADDDGVPAPVGDAGHGRTAARA